LDGKAVGPDDGERVGVTLVGDNDANDGDDDGLGKLGPTEGLFVGGFDGNVDGPEDGKTVG